MELPKTFDPKSTESKWYQLWMDRGYFFSKPDHREPYTVVIPPPNVTGVLHMGHMLNNTIQDVLVRRARMLGKNACWVPGTDHASIATEAKVVQKLKLEGINKTDLSREAFLRHAFEWKDKHGGIILEQLKKLGASCDWNRTHFTMDESYSESVIDVFIDLYRKGKIYRGIRMVNWDPEALTAVSDEEVIYKEVNSKLYFLRYKVVGHEDDWMVVATTRPETIMGDTALCVNPTDDRYKSWIGKEVIVPVSGRKIPIIADEYVDVEFGTGCLKITPAHDLNDYEIGNKHNLPSIDIFNQDGTLNGFGLQYEGMDRFEVRKQISIELKEKGYLVKTEDHINKVGFSERTNAVIEPKLSLQWFLSMKDLSKPALDHVEDDTIRFFPEKYKNTYRHWMENIKDWCISRQLWWGHQIPAWYFGPGPNDFVVAKDRVGATALVSEKLGRTVEESELNQDEDVLDTWFSSWLWPISVFNGLTDPNNEEISYYYPTNDLVTAPEIMFFWVARMIIAGYEYLGQKPFSNVYYTGIVRDKLGRKMSKSLGNSPDPIELINEYGADGVRLGVLISSPAGNDLPFDTSQCEQGRNFANKIWNAYRLVAGWEVRTFTQPEYARLASQWFENKFNQTIKNIDENFARFRISDALMDVYKLVWDDFCSWYLEMIKPEYQQPVDELTKSQAVAFFENLLKILHPFMPFISEELWHALNHRDEHQDLIVTRWPEAKPYDSDLLKEYSNTFEVVSAIRSFRKNNAIATKVKLTLIRTVQEKGALDAILMKMSNLAEIQYKTAKPQNVHAMLVASEEFFIPFGTLINVEEERKKIEEELTYLKGFLTSVQSKLKNDRFVNNAPAEVVAVEKKKEQDAVDKIDILSTRLNSLTS